MLFKPSFLVLTLLGGSSVCSAAVIDDVFHWHNNKDTGGGCKAKKGIVSGWMDDTKTLVEAVMDDLPADPAKTQIDENMRHNLEAWFNIEFEDGKLSGEEDTDAYAKMRDYLTSVQKLLSGTHPTFQDNPNIADGMKKPWLFCDGTWLAETETLYDVQTGNALKDGRRDANLRTYTPSNFAQMNNDDPTKSLLLDMRSGTSPNWDFYAYWSQDIKDYMIEEEENRYISKAGGGPRSFCNTKDKSLLFGLTITRLSTDSTTLCPVAFTKKAEPFERISNSLSQLPQWTVGQPLVETSPRGLTLFHELFHLVKPQDSPGPGDTVINLSPDTGLKPAKCLALPGDDQRTNPDSYVFFAWSFYLTKINPSLQWYTGEAVDPNAMDTGSKRSIESSGFQAEDMVIVPRKGGSTKPKPPPVQKPSSNPRPAPQSSKPATPPPSSKPANPPPVQSSTPPKSSATPVQPSSQPPANSALASSSVPKSSTPVQSSTPASSTMPVSSAASSTIQSSSQSVTIITLSSIISTVSLSSATTPGSSSLASTTSMSLSASTSSPLSGSISSSGSAPSTASNSNTGSVSISTATSVSVSITSSASLSTTSSMSSTLSCPPIPSCTGARCKTSSMPSGCMAAATSIHVHYYLDKNPQYPHDVGVDDESKADLDRVAAAVASRIKSEESDDGTATVTGLVTSSTALPTTFLTFTRPANSTSAA